MSGRAAVETRARALSSAGGGACKYDSGAVNQVIVLIFIPVLRVKKKGRKRNAHFCWGHDSQKGRHLKKS